MEALTLGSGREFFNQNILPIGNQVFLTKQYHCFSQKHYTCPRLITIYQIILTNIVVLVCKTKYQTYVKGNLFNKLIFLKMCLRSEVMMSLLTILEQVETQKFTCPWRSYFTEK